MANHLLKLSSFYKIHFTFCLLLTLILATPVAGIASDKSNKQKSKPTINEKVDITSDRIELIKDSETLKATGNVTVFQGKFRLNADSVNYSRKSGKLFVHGKMILNATEYRMTGMNGSFDINDMTGNFSNGELLVFEGNFRLSGKDFQKMKGDRYIVTGADFTTCSCSDIKKPLWSIRSKKLDFNLQNNLKIQQAILYIKNIPVIYVPYLFFPINKKRQTGFLTPTVRYSKLEGIRINQNFYLVLSPGQDITFSLDSRENKGTGGGFDYRYILAKKHSGRLKGDFFNDTIQDKRRLHLTLRHIVKLSEYENIKADLVYLNEIDIFDSQNDEKISERLERNLESKLFYETGGDHSGVVLLRYFKSLEDQTNSKTVHQLPEIRYSLISYKPKNRSIYYDFNIIATNYYSKEKKSMQRLDLLNSIIFDINPFFAAEFSLRDTYYRLDEEHNTENRLVYYFAANTTTSLFRDFGKFRHILRPSIEYEYIPQPAGNSLLDFDNLDKITDKNAISVIVNNHILKGDKSLLLRVYQSFNLDKIANNKKNRASDIMTDAVYMTSDYWQVHFETGYSLDQDRISYYNAAIDYLKEGFDISIGGAVQSDNPLSAIGDAYNPLFLSTEKKEVQEAGRFVWWSARLNLPFGIQLKNIAYYDVMSNKFLQVKYHALFTIDCVEILIKYDDLVRKNQVSIMISLKGVGGISPEDL